MTGAATNGRFSDYIDVSERIADFSARYPEGTLQTISWDVELVGEQTFIVYRAAAYRTPDDRRPGMGIAWEPFPGKTNFTRDSELMNAETSAWGRAIVACGLTSNRKIASRQEVLARQGGEDANGTEPPAPPRTTAQPAQRSAPGATGNQKRAIHGRCSAAGLSADEQKAILQWVAGTAIIGRIPQAKASELIELLGEDGAGAQDILAEIGAEAELGSERAQEIVRRYFEVVPHGS